MADMADMAWADPIPGPSIGERHLFDCCPEPKIAIADSGFVETMPSVK